MSSMAAVSPHSPSRLVVAIAVGALSAAGAVLTANATSR
jgi:hypothetical protein